MKQLFTILFLFICLSSYSQDAVRQYTKVVFTKEYSFDDRVLVFLEMSNQMEKLKLNDIDYIADFDNYLIINKKDSTFINERTLIFEPDKNIRYDIVLNTYYTLTHIYKYELIIKKKILYLNI